MDINATLRRLREIVNENRLASDLHEAATLGNEMADLFEGLDEWLTRGGHLPTDWLAPRVERALEG